MKSIKIKKITTKYGTRADEIERQFEIIAPRLSWPMLAGLEPRLLELLHAARHADDRQTGDYYCGQWFWHGQLKPQMLALVGHSRPDFHPILGTDAAVDLAYDALVEAVAPCRNCQCCGVDRENIESLED